MCTVDSTETKNVGKETNTTVRPNDYTIEINGVYSFIVVRMKTLCIIHSTQIREPGSFVFTTKSRECFRGIFRI